MKKKLSVTLAVLAFSIITADIRAQSIKFNKPFTTTVEVISSKNDRIASAKKEVTLMSIRLTDKQIRVLLSHKPEKNSVKKIAHANIPNAVNLGMNNVPVLDQGLHGSCVTFAVTAAIDAALGKGDYISQLCQLELGSYLKYKGYFESGWNGTFAPAVYDQILRFGIVSKKNIQQTQGCAGVKEYPSNSLNEGNIMTPEEYRYASENITETIHPHAFMDIYERFDVIFSEEDKNPEAIERALDAIKIALYKGNRVTFGIFLVMVPDCNAGACASNKKKNDTWALTDDINENITPFNIGGHEMVITGYDDNATVTDKNGKVHQGILTLRNSWGADFGDEGNNYMTYEYFKTLATEAHEIDIHKDDYDNESEK